MSKLKVPALFIGILALLVSLYLGFGIKQRREGIETKLNATIKALYDKAGDEAKTKPIEDKIGIFDREVRGTQKTLADTQMTLQKTQTDLADTTKALGDMTAERNKLQGDLAVTQDKLKTTEVKLAETEADRDKAKTDFAQAQKDLATAQAEAAKVPGLELQLAELPKLVEDLKKATAALNTENTLLDGKVVVLEKENLELKTISPQLAGVVLKSDPSWSFVVLDLGLEQHVHAGTEFFVYRDGKLLGKVRVIQVDKNASVANVLASIDSKRPSVVAGDRVLYTKMTAPSAPAKEAALAPAPSK